jgi:penicillin-binding protein 1B|tara:strand:- start:6121 stop:8268 length:2148 start_codon:yes stop_codon:yes gene_type:complete
MAFSAYLFFLNHLIDQRFDDDIWALPSRIYARPLELYKGMSLNRESLKYELELSTYQRVNHRPKPGQYRLLNESVELYAQDFVYSNFVESGRLVGIRFGGDKVTKITDLVSEKPLKLYRLPPAIIGSYHPKNGEDRLLVDRDHIPKELQEILITIEDKQFFNHLGINPISIIRALIANVRAGKTAQGGSTITQQLAKNLFLSSERSLLRKINEAFLALILEFRFNKQTILSAYINEVFLLQQKKIAIHGFGLASQRLFKKPIDQLSTDQLALLVGMVKGPSSYNPILHPKAALARRNLVLKIIHKEQLIDQKEYDHFIQQPLGTVKRLPGINPFPAYVDLVKRQLKSNYSSSELSARGLRIFTPFDPIIQRSLHRGLKNGLLRFGQPNLQSAVVIADYLNGDIQALTGDSQVDYPGFNRAVMAQRPIGSLIKPLLLYGLLEGGRSLATPANDKAINIKQSDGNIWTPKNYDRKFHGRMSLYEAFVNSYNLPFVNFGVQGGLEALVKNLERIDLLKHETIYPSILLGTSAMSALEVAQMYQVIANNGYFSPLTTIRQVSDKDNKVLNRIPIKSQKIFNPAQMIQVQRAMLGVVEEGTAKYINGRFKGMSLAGKTGTTNDTRDSWFSGFSNRLLGVVWLGNDDNRPTQLTGSSGALRVWADIMGQQKLKPFKISRNTTLEWHYINRKNGLLTQQHCVNSVLLPFVISQVPSRRSVCE